VWLWTATSQFQGARIFRVVSVGCTAARVLIHPPHCSIFGNIHCEGQVYSYRNRCRLSFLVSVSIRYVASNAVGASSQAQRSGQVPPPCRLLVLYRVRWNRRWRHRCYAVLHCSMSATDGSLSGWLERALAALFSHWPAVRDEHRNRPLLWPLVLGPLMSAIWRAAHPS
jgi:hypothetical protein